MNYYGQGNIQEFLDRFRKSESDLNSNIYIIKCHMMNQNNLNEITKLREDGFSDAIEKLALRMQNLEEQIRLLTNDDEYIYNESFKIEDIAGISEELLGKSEKASQESNDAEKYEYGDKGKQNVSR